MFLLRIATMFVLGILQGFAIAAEPGESDPAEQWPDGRHRFDLSYHHVDSREAVSDVVLPGYSIAAGRFRVGVTGSYLSKKTELEDPGTGETIRRSESGWGDTRITMQYDPSENLSNSPWIPDQLGLFTTVTAPTGDAQAGLGADSWQVEIGFGAPVFLSPGFALLPSGYYRSTFSEKPNGLENEELGLTLGLYRFFPN